MTLHCSKTGDVDAGADEPTSGASFPAKSGEVNPAYEGENTRF